MLVPVYVSLLALADALKKQLEERQYPYTVCTNPIPGSILWRLKVLYEPEEDQSQPQSQPESQSQPQSQSLSQGLSQSLSQEPQGASQNPWHRPTSSQGPAQAWPPQHLSQRQKGSSLRPSQPQQCPMGPGECHVSHEHWTPRVRNPATWIGSLCESQSQTVAWDDEVGESSFVHLTRSVSLSNLYESLSKALHAVWLYGAHCHFHVHLSLCCLSCSDSDQSPPPIFRHLCACSCPRSYFYAALLF